MAFPQEDHRLHTNCNRNLSNPLQLETQPSARSPAPSLIQRFMRATSFGSQSDQNAQQLLLSSQQDYLLSVEQPNAPLVSHEQQNPLLRIERGITHQASNDFVITSAVD